MTQIPKPASAHSTCGFVPAEVRKHFPIFNRLINDKRIVYLDSANSTQKPNQVIDAMTHFLQNGYAPINRSAYRLAADATELYEGARQKVADFIGATRREEVIFTKNATEAMNLIVHSWGRSNLTAGDAVLLTHMEHHANIVPWQMLQAERGIEIRWVPLTEDGQLDLTDLDSLIEGVKAFSFTAMSNVLGTINPVRRLTDAAHAHGAVAIVDACQSVPHQETDVADMGADLMAFSSHKLCGPTGIGILWGKEAVLDAMPPFMGGGSMITDVRLDGFTAAPLPDKFEAGTPPIVEAIGLGAAVDFISALGMPAIRQHEMQLTQYALDTLNERFGDDITIHGPTNVEVRGATLSFAFKDVHSHDISQILDEQNVYVRAGHHCAKPLMRSIGAGATARASFYIYNDEADVDALADALVHVDDVFSF
jgi:cysteine desulfurase / selenocysteine lyase